MRKDAEDKREGTRGEQNETSGAPPNDRSGLNEREGRWASRRDKSPNMLGNSPDKYISILRSAISPDFRHIIEPTRYHVFVL